MFPLPDRNRGTIAVYAKDSSTRKEVTSSQSNWNVIACNSFNEIEFFAKSGALDAIALPFDAMDEGCRDRFLRLASLQCDTRPVLISYATFNPDWIENLAFGSGANIHIRGELNASSVFDVLDEYLLKKSKSLNDTSIDCP